MLGIQTPAFWSAEYLGEQKPYKAKSSAITSEPTGVEVKPTNTDLGSSRSGLVVHHYPHGEITSQEDVCLDINNLNFCLIAEFPQVINKYIQMVGQIKLFTSWQNMVLCAIK